MTLHERKVLRDTRSNKKIGIIKKDLLTMHKRQNILTYDKEKQVASVAKKHLIQLHSNAEIDLESGEHLEVDGSILGRKFNIKKGDSILAHVQHSSLTLNKIFLDKDTYCLTVRLSLHGPDYRLPRRDLR